MELHDKFIEALERIQTALFIDAAPEPAYISLLWSDLAKYWAINPAAVLRGMEAFRTSTKYRHYPKIADLIETIERQLYPSPDDAFSEAQKFCTDLGAVWSHDVVREAARGIGSHDLKTASGGALEALRRRFNGRYSDVCAQWTKGRRFAFDAPAVAYQTTSVMDTISGWCSANRAGDEKPDPALLYYLTRRGPVSERLRDSAIKSAKSTAWWSAFIEKNGGEPIFPAFVA